MERIARTFDGLGNIKNHEITIKGDPAPATGHAGRTAQHDLLRQCLNTPGMLDCGTLPFKNLVMRHDGEAWVIELVAAGI